MVECGGDCFACHSQNKLIESNRIEHQNLASCKECHINKEDLFNYPAINNNSTLMNLLKNKWFFISQEFSFFLKNHKNLLLYFQHLAWFLNYVW